MYAELKWKLPVVMNYEPFPHRRETLGNSGNSTAKSQRDPGGIEVSKMEKDGFQQENGNRTHGKIDADWGDASVRHGALLTIIFRKGTEEVLYQQGNKVNAYIFVKSKGLTEKSTSRIVITWRRSLLIIITMIGRRSCCTSCIKS
jgi:hypothetical protein